MPAQQILKMFGKEFLLRTTYLTTHVGRQCKGRAALKVGLLPASFALARVPPFGLLPH